MRLGMVVIITVMMVMAGVTSMRRVVFVCVAMVMRITWIMFHGGTVVVAVIMGKVGTRIVRITVRVRMPVAMFVRMRMKRLSAP
jgi:hypothetical protein